MAGATDKEMAIARVYSGAMLDLAEARGEADSLLAELRELTSFLDADQALERFFTSPTIDSQAREQSIERMFRGRASDVMVNSLHILNRKGRLGIFRAVVEAYHADHQTRLGRVEAVVRSAVPLTDGLRSRLREVISSQTGKTAELVEHVDESLIGGVVVQVEGKKLDASVACKLREIGRLLHDRAMNELARASSYVADGAA